MTERRRPVGTLSTEELLEQMKNALGAFDALEQGNRLAAQRLRRHWRALRDELDRRAAEAGPQRGRPKDSLGRKTEGEEG
jgi:hypothetical protein